MIAPSIAFISPGGGEFLLIMLVLILLFGAKDAPRIFRGIHETLDKIQRAAASFRYKIMYGDLHSDSSSQEPYDVEADYPEEEEKESGVRDQESSNRELSSELEPKNPEKKTEPPEFGSRN